MHFSRKMHIFITLRKRNFANYVSQEINVTVIDWKCHGLQEVPDMASSTLKIEKVVTIPKIFAVLPCSVGSEKTDLSLWGSRM